MSGSAEAVVKIAVVIGPGLSFELVVRGSVRAVVIEKVSFPVIIVGVSVVDGVALVVMSELVVPFLVVVGSSLGGAVIGRVVSFLLSLAVQ